MARVPFVPQVETADCGVATLAMVLRMFGRYVPLRRLRGRVDGTRAGMTAYDLVLAARAQGLHAEAVRLAGEDLEELALPAILHWNSNHYVVLEAVTARRGVVVDPRHGRARLTRVELARRFSGLAIELARAEGFRKVPVPWRRFVASITAGVQWQWLLLPFVGWVVVLGALFWVLPGYWAQPPEHRSTTLLIAVVLFPVLRVCLVTLRDRQLGSMRQALRDSLDASIAARVWRQPPQFFERRAPEELAARIAELGRSWQLVMQALLVTAEVLTVSIVLACALAISTVGGLAVTAAAASKVALHLKGTSTGRGDALRRQLVAGHDRLVFSVAAVLGAVAVAHGMSVNEMAAVCLALVLTLTTVSDALETARDVPQLWSRLAKLWDLLEDADHPPPERATPTPAGESAAAPS
jgi:ATP-binding cassette subfamily B protein RaxB